MSYAHPRSSSRRLTGLVVTVALHIVLLYALIHGLARKIVEIVVPPLETKIIEEIKPPADKPPPPPPKLATPPPPFIPPPEVNIQFPMQSAPTITVSPTPPPAAPPPVFVPTPAPPAVAATPPQTIEGSCEKPPYQPAWRRAGEEGEVRLRVDVEANGRVSDATIERSSGYRRLDEAARESALECRYRPAVGADGRPMRAALIKVYRWRLTDN
jgi:protein TonB